MTQAEHIDRVREALRLGWRQEQDGRVYVVFREEDYDALRHRLSEAFEAQFEEEQG